MGALVARLRQGDAAAFREAHDAFAPRLFAFLLRLSGQRAIAEELAQETWFSLAENAAWLRPDTELGAWLFTVARNHHASHRRWRLLDGSRLAELFQRPRAEVPTPEANAAGAQTQARFEAALASLPLAAREVLSLVVVEHFEPNEAAKVLGVSAEALRQRLSRARAALAAVLGEER